MGEFLKRLGISIDDLEEIIGKSPSLRGVLVGYLAEKKLVEEYFKDLNPEKLDERMLVPSERAEITTACFSGFRVFDIPNLLCCYYCNTIIADVKNKCVAAIILTCYDNGDEERAGKTQKGGIRKASGVDEY